MEKENSTDVCQGTVIEIQKHKPKYYSIILITNKKLGPKKKNKFAFIVKEDNYESVKNISIHDNIDIFFTEDGAYINIVNIKKLDKISPDGKPIIKIKILLFQNNMEVNKINSLENLNMGLRYFNIFQNIIVYSDKPLSLFDLKWIKDYNNLANKNNNNENIIKSIYKKEKNILFSKNKLSSDFLLV